MKKNYDLLNSPEIQYIIYVIQQVQKLKQKIENHFSKRDSKLNLLLDENYSDVKKEADKGLKEIIDFINNLDIYNLDRNVLDKELHSFIEDTKINDLINWWDYVEEELKSIGKTLQ
jgi:uncharacterized protein YgfB (UPF0149 family)